MQGKRIFNFSFNFVKENCGDDKRLNDLSTELQAKWWYFNGHHFVL